MQAWDNLSTNIRGIPVFRDERQFLRDLAQYERENKDQLRSVVGRAVVSDFFISLVSPSYIGQPDPWLISGVRDSLIFSGMGLTNVHELALLAEGTVRRTHKALGVSDGKISIASYCEFLNLDEIRDAPRAYRYEDLPYEEVHFWNVKPGWEDARSLLGVTPAEEIFRRLNEACGIQDFSSAEIRRS